MILDPKTAHAVVPRMGKTFGRSLLRDAVVRANLAAEHIGIRAMVVHAKDDASGAFYRRFGFADTPINPLTLIMRLA